MPKADKLVNLTPGTGRFIFGLNVTDLSGEPEFIQFLGGYLRDHWFFLCRTDRDGVYSVAWKGRRGPRKLPMQVSYQDDQSSMDEQIRMAKDILREAFKLLSESLG